MKKRIIAKRAVWKPSRKKLGGYACIELKVERIPGIPIEDAELSLQGRYGVIWKCSNTHYRAAITSSKIAKRYLPAGKWPVLAGDEVQVTFPEADLSLWVERLKVPKTRPAQARLANAFGKPSNDAPKTLTGADVGVKNRSKGINPTQGSRQGVL